MLAFAQNQSGTVGGASGLATGAALASNGANTAGIQTKSVLDARRSGVDCTGVSDSASALNALTGSFPRTDNTISGRTLSFGGCTSIKLSNTWLIKNQAGFVIDGLTRSGAAGKGVHIIWAGPESGVMIDMEYVDGFQVRGLFVDGSTNGGVGIQIDKNGSGGIWNTTDGRLTDNTLEGTQRIGSASPFLPSRTSTSRTCESKTPHSTVMLLPVRPRRRHNDRQLGQC